MATLVPLNTFKTVTAELNTAPRIFYTTPEETATIILMAQITNITTNYECNVTFAHVSNTGIVVTELVKNFDIVRSDAASVLTGRLVLEENASVMAYSGANANLKMTLSILETSLI
jgi:hypothetical protein